MRTWLRAVVATPSAAPDMKEHLTELIDAEDKLSKARTLEDLHYQRGKVDGVKLVLFALNNALQEKR